MTELSLGALTSTWAVFLKEKRKKMQLHFTFLQVFFFFKHRCGSTFQLFPLKASSLLFPGVLFFKISPRWREIVWSKKKKRHSQTWRGFEDFSFQLLDCGTRRWWRIVVLLLMMKKLFSCSAKTHVHRWKTDGADKEMIEIYWFSTWSVGTMQSTGDYISADQLYLAVCTMIVATVWTVIIWFLYRRSSRKKNPSTVCLWFIFFAFFFLLFLFSYWRAVHFLPALGSRGT